MTPAQKAAATRRANLAAKAGQKFTGTLNQPTPAFVAPTSAKPVTIQTAIGIINALDEAQLRALNKAVVARIRQFSSVKAVAAMQNFAVGQQVKFTTKSGELVKGELLSFGPKNVKLRDTLGRRWTVYPGFLSAA